MICADCLYFPKVKSVKCIVSVQEASWPILQQLTIKNWSRLLGRTVYSPAVWVRKYLNEYPNQRLPPNPHGLQKILVSGYCSHTGFFMEWFRTEDPL